MKAVCLMGCMLITGIGHAGPVASFGDIEYWVGAGRNEAAVAIDWMGDSDADESRVWGYRWDGEATGADMLLAVVAADPRLFVKLQDHGDPLGFSLYGIGYDDGDGHFGLDDGTLFDSRGIADVPGPSDAAMAVDVGDLYGEGWFTAFWHYGVSTGNPFAGGSWSGANEGAATRSLSEGDWDSWAYTPTFNFEAFAENPAAAAVPEPMTIVLGLVMLLVFLCRRGGRAAAGSLMVLAAANGGAALAGPYATDVISYLPGAPVGVANPGPYQTDGSQALGEPTRDTGFGSQVGVFYAPFEADELVIVGAGGELTVRFDDPVEDDPHNPFGVDLLVFGNSAYVAGPDGRATGAFTEPGNIAVSQDNVTWFGAPDVFADDLFPTLGYSDTVHTGFGNSGGTIVTDFTRPVDPSFEAIGLPEESINAAYAGSGGGTGIDLATVGLAWIQYVRVWQPADATWSTEIDAFADVTAVPEPRTWLLVLISLVILAGYRRRFPSGVCIRGVRPRFTL